MWFFSLEIFFKTYKNICLNHAGKEWFDSKIITKKNYYFDINWACVQIFLISLVNWPKLLYKYKAPVNISGQWKQNILAFHLQLPCNKKNIWMVGEKEKMFLTLSWPSSCPHPFAWWAIHLPLCWPKIKLKSSLGFFFIKALSKIVQEYL